MKKISLASALVILMADGSNALAAGYSTNLTSTSGLATSYAGSVTGIHDASDVFYNPAVTAGKKHNEIIASLSYLRLDIDPHGATGKLSGGTTISGNSSQAGSNSFVPAFYLATPINDKTTFNFAVTSPFGLSTKYDPSWAGRYRAVESSITTVNFNPSISHKISDQLSVGVGVVAQYMQATLTNAVYTGGNDAIGKMNANDWGYGYNLGAKYQVNDKLKLGIGYRSKIDYNLSGSSRVAALGLYSGVTANTSTPESLTAGLAYKLNKQLELAYDVTWTRWSRLKSLVVYAEQNANLNDSSSFNWHDSFIHSVGGNYKLSDNILLRAGVAYEKNGITDATAEPRVPGGDAIWTTLGFNQKLGKGWSFDGTYAHLFYRPTHLNVASSTATVNSLSVKYKTRVDVFSIAFKKDF
ncbi:MAG: OmpP1/FadL family transporter [Rickettsiales bacterium]|nr:OmpP1/FadL family transporter [Rickettsiales bacterium]